jgi:hypothetical protein
VFFVVSDGAITQQAGMIIGASTVLVYTVLGRHVLGGDHRFHPDDHHRARHALHRLGVSGIVPGGAEAVIAHAAQNDKFNSCRSRS